MQGLKAVDLLHSIERVGVDPGDEFEWTTAFGPADLKQLADEVYATYANVRTGEMPAGELDAVLHEWRESALALRSPELKAAFEAANDEVPLTAPGRSSDEHSANC